MLKVTSAGVQKTWRKYPMRWLRLRGFYLYCVNFSLKAGTFGFKRSSLQSTDEIAFAVFTERLVRTWALDYT